ncbi:hypothetical protein CAEBREN_11170 [Caenorhabditis brenneri]|uniref:F-box associated domain-containing protein n=1 Tax=Caenorhabditis brenneri TaxID=135651 RepID=G0P778_CAEBE|nr:hypothetical protein CAEBREN_11170 [Caenorhabditis brenneri]
MNKRARRALDTWKCPIDQWCFSSADSITLSKPDGKTNDRVIIRIQPKKENEERGVVRMRFGDRVLSFKVEKPEKKMIGERKRLGYDPTRKINVYSSSKKTKTVNFKLRLNELLCHGFLGIFNPLQFSMHWTERITNINTLFIWKITKTFESIWLVSRTDDAFSVTEKTLKFLLEDVTADKADLDLRCTTEGFKYVTSREQVSKIKKLVLWKSDFLQFDNFIHNLNRPYLKCAVPSWRAINVILKEWINGDNDVIVDLALNEINNAFMNEAVAFEGIETTPTAFNDDQLEERTGMSHSYWDRNDKLDIERTRDSRKATLFLQRGCITLFVWTDDALEKIRNSTGPRYRFVAVEN